MNLRKYLFTSSFITAMAVIFVLLISASCVVILEKQQDLNKKNQLNLVSLDNTSSKTMVANPASKNCINKGGRLEIRNNKKGEYGVCLFEDNRQCEEWAFFRSQCPEGGVKITGYDSDAEVYCAITGGQVEGVGTEKPMCKRIDGTYCNAQANLDGECPDPNNKNPNAGNIETP